MGPASAAIRTTTQVNRPELPAPASRASPAACPRAAWPAAGRRTDHKRDVDKPRWASSVLHRAEVAAAWTGSGRRHDDFVMPISASSTTTASW